MSTVMFTCPCCDAPAKLDSIMVRARRAKTSRETFAVKCSAPTPCVSTYDAGGAFGGDPTADEAIARWNRRARSSEALDLMVALDALMAWDRRRKHPLPYLVRDPIRQAMKKLWGAP